MKTQLTTKLLASISADISSGKVLWGLLRANEYLSTEHPLHRALVAKASSALLEASPLSERIMAGACMGELSAEEQADVRAESRASVRVVQKRTLPVRRKSYGEWRREVRALRAA